MPSGRVTAAQAAASRIRDAPASSRASCMVWGRPRPMPMGTRLTNLESNRASGVTAISLMGKERPWVMATTFSLMATTSPGSERDTADARTVERRPDRRSQVVVAAHQPRPERARAPRSRRGAG